jgi:PhoPQ-activated pathogenicity-related protein
MDAVQAFAKQEWKADVEKFVVTGASKRGWTSWLTAASGDKRVKAIAPMVIDTLNFPVQMKNQVAAFGEPSEMIADYTRAKLVPIPDTSAGKALWQMVDPHVYCEKITVPKMLIHGTNDPYWPQDALNTYWDDLKGDKYVCYVPNAGHNLREKDKDGKEEMVPLRAVNTLAAFARSQILDKPMPTLGWKFVEGDELKVTHSYGSKVNAIREWSAEATTRDFRQARWNSTTLMQKEKGVEVHKGEEMRTVRRPKSGFKAVFVEAEFETDHGPLHLTTQIQILEAKK